jgi:hypothetical protein
VLVPACGTLVLESIGKLGIPVLGSIGKLGIQLEDLALGSFPRHVGEALRACLVKDLENLYDRDILSHMFIKKLTKVKFCKEIIKFSM